MSSRFESIFEHASALASVSRQRLLRRRRFSSFGLATMLHAQELFFSIASLLVIAGLGAFSLYIARGAKWLTRRPRIFLSFDSGGTTLNRDQCCVTNSQQGGGVYVWVR